MKPQTAAKKLGIYLPATPEDFQAGAVTHAQFRELQTNPPEWLAQLRREGPHPRPVVAQKLGISVTALKKNDMDKPLTTAEINQLLADAPQWLTDARTAHAAAHSPANAADSDGQDVAADGTPLGQAVGPSVADRDKEDPSIAEDEPWY